MDYYPMIQAVVTGSDSCIKPQALQNFRQPNTVLFNQIQLK